MLITKLAAETGNTKVRTSRVAESRSIVRHRVPAFEIASSWTGNVGWREGLRGAGRWFIASPE